MVIHDFAMKWFTSACVESSLIMTPNRAYSSCQAEERVRDAAFSVVNRCHCKPMDVTGCSG